MAAKNRWEGVVEAVVFVVIADSNMSGRKRRGPGNKVDPSFKYTPLQSTAFSWDFEF